MVALGKYSYRPYAAGIDQKLTEPRTYFCIRDYLHEKQKEGHASLTLPNMWITNLSEAKISFDKDVVMPSNANNVALCMAANSLYGITATALSNWTMPDNWFDPHIYLGTVDYIIYEVTHNFSSRPDASNLYYTSKIVLYWFMSHTIQLLKATETESLFLEIETALNDLEPVLKNNVTDELLKQVNHNKIISGPHSLTDSLEMMTKIF